MILRKHCGLCDVCAELKVTFVAAGSRHRGGGATKQCGRDIYITLFLVTFYGFCRNVTARAHNGAFYEKKKKMKLKKLHKLLFIYLTLRCGTLKRPELNGNI